MQIKLFELGRAQYTTIELPEGATVEQLALQRSVTWVFKRLGTWAPVELQPNEVLVEWDKLIFAAATVTTVNAADGTTQTVYAQKKISWANEDCVLKVRFVQTVVSKELTVPCGLTVKDVMDLAGIRHWDVRINGEPIWFGKAINEDTTIELAVAQPTADNAVAEYDVEDIFDEQD